MMALSFPTVALPGDCGGGCVVVAAAAVAASSR